MRSRYRCYPGARLCVRGAVADLFCELDACAEDALRGHCLDSIPVLTGKLVIPQSELSKVREPADRLGESSYGRSEKNGGDRGSIS